MRWLLALRRAGRAISKDRIVIKGKARGKLLWYTVILYFAALTFFLGATLFLAQYGLHRDLTDALFMIGLWNYGVGIFSGVGLRFSQVRVLFAGSFLFGILSIVLLGLFILSGAPLPANKHWLIGGAVTGPIIMIGLFRWYSRSAAGPLFRGLKQDRKEGSKKR